MVKLDTGRHITRFPGHRGAAALLLSATMVLAVACAPAERPDEVVEPADRPDLVAPQLLEPLTIDGELDDWPMPYLAAMASSLDLRGRVSDRWGGREDHALWLWAAWDDDYLYLAFERADDLLRYDQAQAIEDAELQDTLVLYLVAPDHGQDDEKTIFHFTVLDGEPATDAPGARYAVTRSQTLGPFQDLAGEIHELALPHALLPVSVKEGLTLRIMPVSVDVDERDRQETVLTWRGGSRQDVQQYALLKFGGPPEPAE